jgi:Ferritin-like
MLKLRPAIVHDIRAATTAVHLYQHLQAAIALEHATLPPYLTALYSIKPGYNQEASTITWLSPPMS